MSNEYNDAVDFEAGKTEHIEFTASESEISLPVEVNNGKWALKDRLKSKVLWAAIVGCIVTIFSVFDVWEKIGITSEQFSETIGAIGGLLAAFGILNDPNNREGF